ncbi:glycoside hydrolase family 18 protein [Glonium stellatum]|uniref:chitinase n=1 Tax=Glonium stellatum TaxID=574774 RepID=A0A8E2F5W6_9PEZI|nr:glycoside hydrolase family 18 protein [Glonium stellatum]
MLISRRLCCRLHSSSGDYTCGPGKPCGNGACCGDSGWCGYGPTYCECGKYASTPGKGCPLNVCCSEFGFCGTTSDFCGKACQSHCTQPKPKVRKSDTQTKVVAYYEGWSSNHACGQMTPEEIPVSQLTHLIFAFGFITPGNYRITNMPDVSPKMFGRVTDLKEKNNNLKVMIALGGWFYTDPGQYQEVFTTMVSSAANRKEYPGADDRGGHNSDGVNFTQLLKEMKVAFGKRYILTFTAPTSYYAEQADWINLMSYDLHGVWDRDNPIGSHVLAHSNLTEIDLALDLFWRNNVDPNKIVLGMGFYGRSFKLSSSSCWKPGCIFSGPGDKGRCTDTPGILSYKEIQDIISSTKSKSYYDKDASVEYLVYGQNNWISYGCLPNPFAKE